MCFELDYTLQSYFFEMYVRAFKSLFLGIIKLFFRIYNNNKLYFYIATLYELNRTLHRFTNCHYPRLKTSNPSAGTITAHYPWAMVIHE